ncbi:MAG TPA: helix-turn-helix domain-containing protein [Gemmatimonadaceae bacterium]|nr:helix-turn-helix domain-containing protein [Gemmatimonadaceae bacterium]
MSAHPTSRLASSAPTPRGSTPLPLVVAHTTRERARALLRSAFPRRRARLVLTRTAEELDASFRTSLVDAAIVDLASASDDTWRAAALAREFPSVPFFGLCALRASEAPALAQSVVLEFADVVVEAIDDAVCRDMVLRHAFSSRFAAALDVPPDALELDTPLQQGAWRAIVAWSGRPVRTQLLADVLGVTREHLSRTFAADGAPNLKRVIDLVRLIAAAELSKNPGYDVRDVAAVLDFASSSHLSSTAQRVVGTRPASLARLRAVDLVDRFTKGHGRSRG